LDIAEAEIARRQTELSPWEPTVRSGYLRRYARVVTSASTGAVFREL
jgi:dihydroxy-acid dehydratase